MRRYAAILAAAGFFGRIAPAILEATSFLALLAAISAASSVSMADDAGDDAGPVTTITPVATAPVSSVAPTPEAVTLTPVAVTLISVLASPEPSPAQIQALIAQLTPGQIASVAVKTMNNPAAFSAFVAQLTPSQAATVLVALQNSPSAISALAATMSLPQTAKVLEALTESPGALAVLVANLNPIKLEQAKVELFLTDLDGWQKVSSLVNPPSAPPKKFGGNWLDAARAALWMKIDRDGYTPEHLAEASALMMQVMKTVH